MVDERFYQRLGAHRLDALAEAIGAQPLSDDDGERAVDDVAALSSAQEGCLTYYDDPKRVGDWGEARPTACLVRADHADAVQEAGAVPLIVERPQVAFVQAARRIIAPRALYDRDYVDDTPPQLADSVECAPGVVIAGGAVLGPDVVVEPGAVIGPGVQIGAGSRIGANAVISFAILGEGCQIHAGAVLGDSGFGLALDSQGPVDAPHFGLVRLGDRVTVGCNTTVDRGRFDDTFLDDDVKVDNLVQIAHNVRIGKGCVIAGCCGIAGSAVLGAGVQLGGAAGVADHVTIGDHAKLAAAAYLMRDVPAGETWAGGPARKIQTFFREVATLSRLAARGKWGTSKET